MYRSVALSFVVYEQQGRERDLPAYLAEISVGGWNAVEMRLDKFFGTKETTEATAVALRVDGHRMYTALMEMALDDPQVTSSVLAVGQAAERAKARELDLRGVTLVPFSGDRPRSEEEIAAGIARVQQIGSSLQRRGIWLGIHNDAAESANGGALLRRILDATKGDANIGLALDVEWIQRGGGDPAAIATAYRDRLKTLHLRQSRDGVWCEDLSDGQVDFKALDKVVRPLKHEVLLVAELNHHPETKLTRRLLDDLKVSRQYVRKTFTV